MKIEIKLINKEEMALRFHQNLWIFFNIHYNMAEISCGINPEKNLYRQFTFSDICNIHIYQNLTVYILLDPLSAWLQDSKFVKPKEKLVLSYVHISQCLLQRIRTMNFENS